MTGRIQSVYVAESSAQAHLLANALRDREIDAFVENDALQFGQGVLPFGIATAPRVMVAEEDGESARQMVLELIKEPPVKERPWQFKMRTMMLLVTAFCAYLAVHRLADWEYTVPVAIGFPIAVLYLAYYAAVVVLVVRFVLSRKSRAEISDS